MKTKKFRYLSILMVALLSLSVFTGCGTTGSSTATASGSANSDTITEITPLTVNYKEEDLNAGWDASTATAISLNGNSISVSGSGASAQGSVLTVKDAGTYVLSGKLSDGQIIIEAGEDDTVRLVLNGASLSSANNAPIYTKQAKKTILTLAEATNNTVEDGVQYTGTAEDEPNAAIFSKSDLTINGTGSLTVKAKANNGIGSKDDLIITGGNITVDAVNDGLRGRDSIAVKAGTITINAGGDGLQANNDEDADKGWIVLDGGVLNITAGNDGIQAETIAQVSGGKLTITTGGGSINASTKTDGEFQPGWGQWKNPEAAQTSSTVEETASAKGLKSAKGILIQGGDLTIDSSDDSLHSNGQIQIQTGRLTISSGDDGIHADTALTINGGTLNIAKSYEGLESAAIIINEGAINLTARDDGLNAAGGNDGSSQGGRPGQNNFSSGGQYYIRITGGYLSINADGDGIDANGALYFNGGTVLVSGPTTNGNGALDYDGACEVTGGILAIAGSAGMAQAPGNTSTQNSLLVLYTLTQKAGTLATLADADGKPLLAFAPAKDYQSIVISTPALAQGKTYTLLSGGTSSTALSDGLYTGGAITGGTKLTDVTISGTVTSIADDGSQASAGMHGGPGAFGGPGGQGGQGAPRTRGSVPPQ